MKNLIETAHAAGHFSTLIKALKAANLTEKLSGKDAFTVFAPNDEAFKKLKPHDLEALLKDTGKLKSILSYHVVAGNIASKDVHGGEVKSISGQTLAAVISGNSVTINGAKVVKADIAASNGMIHEIDAVVLPKGVQVAKAA